METIQWLVRTRRSCIEIGWGAAAVVETNHDSVLALRYDWKGETVIVLHNLSDTEVEVRLEIEGVESLRPLICNRSDRGENVPPTKIPMDPYGYRWFRAHEERERTASLAEG
jgi:maltose alpha-D-glucosyltransferase/alpha-amylase